MEKILYTKKIDTRVGEKTIEVISGDITKLFLMLKRAEIQGISIETVVMPLIGTGNQMLSETGSLKGLVAECRNAVRDIDGIRRIVIADISEYKAQRIAEQIKENYGGSSDKAIFISYSSKDREHAKLLVKTLKDLGIKVWIDFEQLTSENYAGAIVKAILDSDSFSYYLKGKHFEWADKRPSDEQIIEFAKKIEKAIKEDCN